jgi:rod shape-determining protein MreD
MNLFFQHMIRFILLVLIQVLILNNIRFLGYINPYIYILFIFLLPVKFPKWLSLLFAFGLGLIIDSFSNTPGMHTFSTVLIAFLRNPIINLYTNIEEGTNPTPSFSSFGVGPFIKYMITLVIIHHATFYFLEVFSFHDWDYTLLKILLNILVTSTIILGIHSFRKE